MSATPGAQEDPACPAELLPAAARGGPVSHALSRVARLHRIAMGKVLKNAGLYPGQEHLMMRLWEAGPVRQSELIKAVDLDPSTVTKMLQRLEQTGHVRRCPDPKDRRAVLVEATDKSCALKAEVTAAWTSLEEYTLAGIDADERAELTRLLAKVEANLCTETAGCPEWAVTQAQAAAQEAWTGTPAEAQPASTSSVRSTSAAEL
ncbi:MarR family winged helix-turn-helix transcriptional regulator [Streptomyces sp. NPDC020681]|uniref:MarR family winged helix-turn-helix transcriptional regulator n=1 Tax=Streptomyces sp. NPDC020681 TaxID=3365083 RepID=UPI0037B4E80E